MIRADFNEWTLFEAGRGVGKSADDASILRFTQYFKPSSIEQFGNKVAVQWRFLLDISDPPFAQFPDGSYTEDVAVFDCTGSQFALSERSIITKTGTVLYHYKWADPQFVNFSIGSTTQSGSVGAWLGMVACNDELRTPLIAKADLNPSRFISLSSTRDGNGDIFYLPITNEMREENSVTPIVMLRWHEDKPLTEYLKNTILDEPLKFRYEVGKVKFYCVEKKASFLKFDYYDEASRLVWIQVVDPSKEIPRNDVGEASPYGVLLRIACGLNEVQK